MAEKINLKTLKRQDSDARILQAAIKVFGERGYTNTFFTHIAKEAGVSRALAGKRFNSKEELFATAYFAVVEETYTLDRFIPAPECFILSVQETRQCREQNPEGFRLLKQAVVGADLPESFVRLRNEFLGKSNFYRAAKEAQARGELIEGDILSIMLGFVVNIFYQVDLAYTYGNAMLPDAYFLNAIRPFNHERERLLQQRADILEAIGNTFEAFAIIWPEKNEAQLMLTPEPLQPCRTRSLSELSGILVEKTVPPAEQARVRKFMDFSDVTERMGQRKSLFCEYRDIYGNYIRHVVIPKERDEQGRITELLACLRIIED